jgi:Domain of unknown function (DUF3821)
MNVIMFIIRVLKLLPMQGKYVVLALIIILIGAAPVMGSTTKIAAGSPVFVGESNLDISSALNGCHTIAWWQEGADTSAPPQKNMTIYGINTVSDTIYHYNISRENFAGSTGLWYCIDKKPQEIVFEVREPQIDIKVWDLDHNQDVSGKSVPVSANITYRVDTNLYPALLPLNRPDINPSDSFFSVSLDNPLGRGINVIYTGNAGNPQTRILTFDGRPFITGSPYYWKNGKDWNRTARSSTGETLYPPGTYTFTVQQDLNSIQETYSSGGVLNLTGITTKSASVTFVKEPLSPGTLSETQIVTVVTTPPLSQTTAITAVPVSTPVPVKTTYTPLPGWIGVVGILIAGIIVLGKNR